MDVSNCGLIDDSLNGMLINFTHGLILRRMLHNRK